MMETWELMIMAFCIPLLVVLGLGVGFLIMFVFQWIGSAIMLWMKR